MYHCASAPPGPSTIEVRGHVHSGPDTPSGDSAPVSRSAATSGWTIVRPFYWSGTELPSNPNDAWNFNYDNGDQDDDDKDNDNNAAWAVRAG